jgi:hypothetical protein
MKHRRNFHYGFYGMRTGAITTVNERRRGCADQLADTVTKTDDPERE